MLRRSIAILMLTILTMLATGCTKVLMQINPDGSGTWQYGFQIDLDTLESLDEQSSEPSSDDEFLGNLLAGQTSSDEATGIEVGAEQRLENGKRWIYVIAEVPNTDAWTQLQDAQSRIGPQDEATDQGGGMGAPSLEADTDTLLYPVVTVDGNTVRVEISGPPPAEFIEEDEFGLTAFFTPSYELDMPGEVTDTNGEIDSLTGNPVLIIDPTSTEPIFFYAESVVE